MRWAGGAYPLIQAPVRPVVFIHTPIRRGRCGISSDRPVRTNNSHISAVARCDERCWPILNEIRLPALANPPPSVVPKRHPFFYCWWSTCASAPGRSANLCLPKSCWWTFHLSVSTLYGRSLLFSSLYIINIVIVYKQQRHPVTFWTNHSTPNKSSWWAIKLITDQLIGDQKCVEKRHQVDRRLSNWLEIT